MKEFYEKFYEIRSMVNKYLEKALKVYESHKSYEGSWDLKIEFPNYFESNDPNSGPSFIQLTLHCYLLVDGRHYTWSGYDPNAVLVKVENDIKRWIEEECL